jgi:large subunit ribosomal protein LP2
MKHLAAYLLLNLGGNSAPSASEIKAVLSSVGIDADENQLETLLSELKGKDIQTLIAEGSTKLASVPTGGSGGGPGGPAPGPKDPEPGTDEPVNEPEKDDESDDDMGFGLFD